MPWVVYEATYAPQANAEYPNFMPTETRMRFGIPARDEAALLAHLKPQASVTCHAPSIANTCLPGEVVANVVPFDVERAEANNSPPRVVGCAAIDAESEQQRLRQERAEPPAISEVFGFSEGSEELLPESRANADAIAKHMLADPGLECLALVGQASRGESPSLAEARARAVKRLLISLGVPNSRLQSIGAAASVYGAASASTVPAEEQRRVSVRVLLYTRDVHQ